MSFCLPGCCSSALPDDRTRLSPNCLQVKMLALNRMLIHTWIFNLTTVHFMCAVTDRKLFSSVTIHLPGMCSSGGCFVFFTTVEFAQRNQGHCLRPLWELDYFPDGLWHCTILGAIISLSGQAAHTVVMSWHNIHQEPVCVGGSLRCRLSFSLLCVFSLPLQTKTTLSVEASLPTCSLFFVKTFRIFQQSHKWLLPYFLLI